MLTWLSLWLYITFVDFWPDSNTIRGHTLYDFNSFEFEKIFFGPGFYGLGYNWSR